MVRYFCGFECGNMNKPEWLYYDAYSRKKPIWTLCNMHTRKFEWQFSQAEKVKLKKKGEGEDEGEGELGKLHENEKRNQFSLKKFP